MMPEEQAEGGIFKTEVTVFHYSFFEWNIKEKQTNRPEQLYKVLKQRIICF